MHDDLAAGSFDLSVANTRFWDHGDPGLDPTREWTFWNYNLGNLLPGYDVAFGNSYAFGGRNGVYVRNGDESAPVPYRGKVYFIRSNALLAFGTEQVAPAVRSTAATAPVKDEAVAVDPDGLKQKLAAEISKIVQAGHLRPGYLSSGHIDLQLKQACGDNLQDYWHDPSDTLYALLRALPYLPADLQPQTRSYLQSEFAAYLPYQVSHIGWKDGAAREAFELPPEVEADRANYPPSAVYGFDFTGWGGRYGGTGFAPHMFYTLWKYAQVFGGAKTLFDSSRARLSAEPADAVLTEYPFVVNSFIAGYTGYLNLQQLAYGAQDPAIQAKLDRLLQFRRDTFSADTPYTGGDPCQALSVSRNFLYLTPELGQYLHDQALTKVQSALQQYYRVEPYWFVSAFEDTFGEAVIQPLYDVNALFSAKALILKEPREELVRYLDVPAFATGDLFYIQTLVAAIEAPPSAWPPRAPELSGMRSGDHLLLTWKAVAEDINGDPGTISKYQVWRGLQPDFLAGDSSNPSPLAEVDASTLSYVDENDIADPTNYYYLVKAVNDVGLSSAASGHVGKFTQAMSAGSQPRLGEENP